jgi:hypothetical protein
MNSLTAKDYRASRSLIERLLFVFFLLSGVSGCQDTTDEQETTSKSSAQGAMDLDQEEKYSATQELKCECQRILGQQAADAYPASNIHTVVRSRICTFSADQENSRDGQNLRVRVLSNKSPKGFEALVSHYQGRLSAAALSNIEQQNGIYQTMMSGKDPELGFVHAVFIHDPETELSVEWIESSAVEQGIKKVADADALQRRLPKLKALCSAS